MNSKANRECLVLRLQPEKATALRFRPPVESLPDHCCQIGRWRGFEWVVLFTKQHMEFGDAIETWRCTCGAEHRRWRHYPDEVACKCGIVSRGLPPITVQEINEALNAQQPGQGDIATERVRFDLAARIVEWARHALTDQNLYNSDTLRALISAYDEVAKRP